MIGSGERAYAENTFYIPDNPYSSEIHHYSQPPEHYRGYDIFQYGLSQWDVVKGEKIVGMYAGPNGAKKFIDKLIEKEKAA